NDIVLATSEGMSIRFGEKDVREMGRATTGVRGIELEKEDRVIGMVVIRRDATLLVVTEKGLGKRSELSEYRVQHRGGKGIITLKRTEKTGAIVTLKEVLPDDELMIVTKHGVIIRCSVEGIRVIGRSNRPGPSSSAGPGTPSAVSIPRRGREASLPTRVAITARVSRSRPRGRVFAP